MLNFRRLRGADGHDRQRPDCSHIINRKWKFGVYSMDKTDYIGFDFTNAADDIHITHPT